MPGNPGASPAKRSVAWVSPTKTAMSSTTWFRGAVAAPPEADEAGGLVGPSLLAYKTIGLFPTVDTRLNFLVEGDYASGSRRVLCEKTRRVPVMQNIDWCTGAQRVCENDGRVGTRRRSRRA